MIKLYKNLKQYKWLLALIFILLCVQVGTNLWLPTLMSNIVDVGILNSDTKYILEVGIQMVLVTIIGMITMILATMCIARVGMGFARDIRRKLFIKVESFSQNDIDKFGIPSLITRTTNDVTQVSSVTMSILRLMVTAPITMIGGIIMALYKAKSLSIVLAFSVPILLIVIVILAWIAIPLYKIIQGKVDKVNQILREKLNGIRVIRAFNKSEYESKRFNNASKELTDISIKVNRVMAALQPLLALLLNITTVVLVFVGAIKINQGSTKIGDLMAIIQYATQIMFSLVMMAMMFTMIPRGAASAKRINEVLETKSSIKDVKTPKNLKGKIASIEFKNVTFKYEGATSSVLSNLSFKVDKGQILTIIGGTGSGKSTIMNLIPRLYDVTQGEILIDGVNIKEIPQKELRSKIGYAPQKTFLFGGTISENIKYGKNDAIDNQIKESIAIAQAKEFVESMDKQYEHIISQSGTNISGGQKQRIAIARAIIKKPDIYLFDDTFSALDFKTDSNLRKQLKNYLKDSATIIVTQRINTAKKSDKILVLDKGIIAGIGTHTELVKNCSLYKEIAKSQLSKEEMENEFR